VDTRLEVVVIPVADVDRAAAFYKSLGWRLDADVPAGDLRVVQVTPPGSAASVIFGTNVTRATPGAADGMMLVVPDIDAARADLVERGVEVSEVFHDAGGVFHHGGTAGRRPGRPLEGSSSYGAFVSFADPDGNTWYVQEITTRLPGRLDATTSFSSADDLADALRRAAAAHGQHEARTGEADPNWPAWYADYMVREQQGTELPA
jgi:catechol 2,3-dioxygenase-like lactoylglutathione lyase family enzyme